LLGLDPTSLVLIEAAELTFSLLVHTSLPLPMAADRVLRLVFITPRLHLLHHSDNRSEYGTNYGGIFSFWDRLFGTYLDESKRDPARFHPGIKGLKASQINAISWLFTAPWRR